MEFVKFPKIASIANAWHDNMVPPSQYIISEKLDGANAGIVRDDNGIILHSRNTFLAHLGTDGSEKIGNNLAGFTDYIRKFKDVLFGAMSPGDHVYGEWLVPHTVVYPAEMYGHFYMFAGQKFDYLELNNIFRSTKIIKRDVQLGYSTTDIQYLDDLCKEISLQGTIEGVVVYSPEYNTHFKYVLPYFKEDFKNKWVGKLNSNITDVEAGLSSAYPIRAYDKIKEKVHDIKGQLTKSETPMIMGLCWNDFIEEFFARAIKAAGYPVINTKSLKAAFEKSIRELYLTEMDLNTKPQWALERMKKESMK